MLEPVTACIDQYRLLPEHSTIVVAVSGGADSLCLLHLLQHLCGPDKRYPTVQLHVAHLDHQLRGEASTLEAEAVASIAKSWGLPATIGQNDVPALAREEQRSIEDAARTARYRFLREIAQQLRDSTGQEVHIAIAHHMDDQVETLLLHWLRGGGIASMIGLQPLQQEIIRPLLTVTHADTLAYCRKHGLMPLEDESNTNLRFLRNRIRHELLPLLTFMNPGIRATLLRNAEVIRADVDWIDTQVNRAWTTVVKMEEEQRISLERTALLALSLSIQRHLLRHATARLTAGQSPLELRHYRLIEQLLQREYNGEELTLHLPEQLRISRTDDTVVLTYSSKREIEQIAYNKENVEIILPIPGRAAVPGTKWIAVAEYMPDSKTREVKAALQKGKNPEVWQQLAPTPYTAYIDANTLGSFLRVRTRRPGDRLRPLGMQQEKKVQDILVDRHIARAERNQIPLFFSDKHCVWLASISIDDRVRLTGETQRIVRLAIVPA